MNKLMGLVLCGVSGPVLAGAFQLFEQSAAGMGSYRAGAAASALDASTAYFNVAGLTRLPRQQLSSSFVTVASQSNFVGTNIVTDPLLNVVTAQGSTTASGLHVIPALQYKTQLNNDTALALDFGVPFGLGTDWDSDSLVSSSATHSSIQALNFGVGVAKKMNSKLSYGFGFDLQKLHGSFDLVGRFAGDPATNSTSSNNVASISFGWHGGLLYELSQETRFGLSYRSAVKHKAKGKSVLAGMLAFTADDIRTTNVYTDLTLPATVIGSIHHDFTAKLSLMASSFHTRWSSIPEITLHDVATPFGIASVVNATNFKDTWSFAGGLNYQASDSWNLSLGAGYDETPTNSVDRDVRLPDANKFALAAGAQYRINNSLSASLSYLKLLPPKVAIDKHTDIPNTIKTHLKGEINGGINLVGVQLNWSF